MNYTTIEQSEKLLELGMNPDTADMAIVKDNTYCNALSAFNGVTLCQNYNEIKDKANYIPCWSLGALLNIIPNYQLQTQVNGKIGILFGCKNELKIMEADTVINTVFQMVVWLLENGYIKTEIK